MLSELEATERVHLSRAAVEEIVHHQKTIYGINTGLDIGIVNFKKWHKNVMRKNEKKVFHFFRIFENK